MRPRRWTNGLDTTRASASKHCKRMLKLQTSDGNWSSSCIWPETEPTHPETRQSLRNLLTPDEIITLSQVPELCLHAHLERRPDRCPGWPCPWPQHQMVWRATKTNAILASGAYAGVRTAVP